MESEARYYFRCDHWPWSRSFCVVGPILSVVFQGKSMTHSKAHYPLRLGAAGVFYQNAVLIEGLRFTSRVLDMITHTTWPPVHISFCLAIHPSPLSLHLLSLHTFHCHPIIYHLLFTPCVIAPSPYPLPPPPSFLAILLLISLHYFFTSPSVPSEKLVELAAPEFWSVSLWSTKAAKLPFPFIYSCIGCG